MPTEDAPRVSRWRKSGQAIERLVGADVHPDEWRVVLIFFANLFLLLTAYYILKVIREPLILLGGGAVSRSYARGLQAVILAVIIPGYSLLANRIEPDRLVKWIMTFFVACLATFFVLGRAGVPVGFAFFVWLGIFSTLSIAQFWSLANDLFSEAEGKRLFPLVAAGGTLGGIVGAQISARAIEVFDPYQLMLVAAGALALCIALTHLARGAGLRHRSRVVSEGRGGERDRRGGFTLVLRDRTLLLIAASVVILNFINTSGDFLLAQAVSNHARDIAAHATNPVHAKQQFISAFYGDFQTYISTLTAVIQFLVVARLFKAVGIGRALLVVPLIAVGGYGLSALLPVLAVIATVKVLENSADYSLQNTVQQALFLHTSRDAKYKAKAAIDTLGVRLGDLASTAVVFVGTRLGLSLTQYALVNLVIGVAWLGLIFRLMKRYRQATELAATAPSGSPARPQAALAAGGP
jgi:AAA family ATP:ADP antiporter